MTMRRIASLTTLAALALCAGTAAAAPPGQGLITDGPYECNGVETTIVRSAGNSGYIGDQHYVVESFTFTSSSGTSETRSFGHKGGLSDAQTCSQSDDEGTFTVVLLPTSAPSS